jgi:hypothetical protein
MFELVEDDPALDASMLMLILELAPEGELALPPPVLLPTADSYEP